MASGGFDAILVVAFGGPEGRDDVIPFLENVLRGRNVPRERMLEVAEHYYHFEGISPINAQVRELIDRLRPELQSHGIHLPIYWGNRNWHPLLADTLQQMKRAGIHRAVAFVTSAYSSYSSCRQYLQDIERAQQEVGAGAPQVEKLRPFFNHPLFVEANADRVRTALAEFPDEVRDQAHVVYTAHSIPLSMASQCDYAQQLEDIYRLVSESVNVPAERWSIAWQSRSGRPEDPWLAPDILDHLQALTEQGVSNVLVAPVGFLSDHMEVLYDLDVEARDRAAELRLNLVRAETVGTHPLFVQMIRKLIEERLSGTTERAAVGRFPARPDACPADCCPVPRRPVQPTST
jgi:ferrochelatase